MDQTQAHHVVVAFSIHCISPVLCKVLLPAQAPPSSPHSVSMAHALVLPALSGLLATASVLHFAQPQGLPFAY